MNTQPTDHEILRIEALREAVKVALTLAATREEKTPTAAQIVRSAVTEARHPAWLLRYEYEASKQIAQQEAPFYALVMAAMRQADTENLRRLRLGFEDVWQELQARYNAPGGLLPGEHA